MLKKYIDFEYAYLDNTMKYHLIGLNQKVVVGQKLDVDLCSDKTRYTYIKANVLKVKKNEIVVDYKYID